MNEVDWTRFKCCSKNNETPKVHIAIHYGLCRWLHTPTLRSPIFEVSNCFGVPINELSRFGTFSTQKGEYVASNRYTNNLIDRSKSTRISIQLEKSIIYINFEIEQVGYVSGKEKTEYHYCFFNFDID